MPPFLRKWLEGARWSGGVISFLDYAWGALRVATAYGVAIVTGWEVWERVGLLEAIVAGTTMWLVIVIGMFVWSRRHSPAGIERSPVDSLDQPICGDGKEEPSRVDILDMQMKNLCSQLDQHHASIDGRIDEILNDVRQFKTRVHRWLIAKHLGDIAPPLHDEIVRNAEELKVLRLIRPKDDLPDWDIRLEEWMESVKDYDSVAKRVDSSFPPAVRIDPEDYRYADGKVDHTTFSSLDTLHRYQSLCIILKQVLALHQKVMTKIRSETSNLG